MRHSAYKRENYTFINPNIQVINTICKVNRPLCVVGRLGRVKKRKRAEDDGRLFSLFPSSLARLLFLLECPAGACAEERGTNKWCLLCDNQIWFPFLDARVVKKRGIETCWSRLEPVRHPGYFFRFKVNIVAPFIRRWGHLRCPSANMQDGSI